MSASGRTLEPLAWSRVSGLTLIIGVRNGQDPALQKMVTACVLLPLPGYWRGRRLSLLRAASSTGGLARASPGYGVLAFPGW